MRNILFVINSLTIGGSEKSLVSLLNLLDYSKYKVDLLMIKKGGEFEKYIPKEVNVLDELDYYRYLSNRNSSDKLIKKLKYGYYRLKTSLKLRLNWRKSAPIHAEQILYKSHGKILEDFNEKYDVAIAYSQGIPTYFVADKINADKKIAWINCDYETTMYDKEYDENFYSKFDKIIAVSKSIRESIVRLNKEYEKKIEVILDIVDPNLIEEMADEEKVFEDKSTINILTVARLVIVHKGYDIAIKAAKLLKDNNYKFKWYVVGDGEDRENMQTMIRENNLQNNFILLGKKDNPYPYMKNCDIYVQPSKKEGFGLTVIEAKILKKPIICTNFNTAEELINNEIDGLIVDKNEEAIYKGITKFIEDKEFMDSIKKYINNKQNYNSTKEINKINMLIGN